MKSFLRFSYLFLITFFLISCGSDDSGGDDSPSDTELYISKMILTDFDSTKIHNFSYNNNNEIVSIENEVTLFDFSYSVGNISKMSVIDKASGIESYYIKYHYNENGTLKYTEGTDVGHSVFEFDYENGRVSRVERYGSLVSYNKGLYDWYDTASYSDDTKNVSEYRRYNASGVLTRISQRSYGQLNKRYMGKAMKKINLPLIGTHFKVFNYYTNDYVKAWRSGTEINDLYLYQEATFQYDEAGYCDEWVLKLLGSDGSILSTRTMTFEYIAL